MRPGYPHLIRFDIGIFRSDGIKFLTDRLAYLVEGFAEEFYEREDIVV